MIGGTFMHLSEQALTTKVNMGAEPLNNTIWGLNMSWKKESQWLTNMLDKIPFLHLTQPRIFRFLQSLHKFNSWSEPGHTRPRIIFRRFENTKNTIDISQPTSWVISSVPSDSPNQQIKQHLAVDIIAVC